jgi:hypothetical protein
MQMIEVYRIPIPKDEFRRLPKRERSLVLVSGHILNQISVFLKLVRFSTNKDPSNVIEAQVSGMQSQLILHCLLGVLAEACAWLRERKDTIERYLPIMNIEGRNAYDKLKPNLEKNALLLLVRHNYIYHYPTEKNVERIFEKISDDEPWEWYLSETNTNSAYFSSEHIFGYALMQVTGETTQTEAFRLVMAKAMEVANNMPDFLMRLIEVIMIRHLGPGVLKPLPGTAKRMLRLLTTSGSHFLRVPSHNASINCAMGLVNPDMV